MDTLFSRSGSNNIYINLFNKNYFVVGKQKTPSRQSHKQEGYDKKSVLARVQQEKTYSASKNLIRSTSIKPTAFIKTVLKIVQV